MKNRHLWKPSKFVMTRRGLRASRNPQAVGIASRFIGDLQAAVCQKAIQDHARGVLLDLGCGTVPYYETYKGHVEDNICVDWGNSPHELLHLDHRFDLNHGIPLPHAGFDTILATDVLEHIANPDRLWSEIARLLKPEGKIILTVPFFYLIHESPHDYCRYTEHRLRMFCLDNGLEIVSLEPYGGSSEVLIDFIAKHIRFSRILSAIHLLLGKAFVRSPINRMITAVTSQYFPLGYCLIAQKPAQDPA